MTDREVLAAMWATRRRSWDEDTDDASRLVLEQAYDAMRVMRHGIRQRNERLVRMAICLEAAECAAQQRKRSGKDADTEP